MDIDLNSFLAAEAYIKNNKMLFGFLCTFESEHILWIQAASHSTILPIQTPPPQTVAIFTFPFKGLCSDLSKQSIIYHQNSSADVACT